MHLIFFGSGPFAVPGLLSLVEAGHSVPIVISQPDRPAGRGGKMKATPLAETARSLGLAVFTPEGVKSPEVIEALRVEQPELCVVIAYGHKIPSELLHVPTHGFINAHASLLPKYRGAAPVPHAILNGEAETGVTIFRIEEDWDTGPVFGYVNTPIRPADTSQTVLSRLSVMSAELLVNIVSEIESGTAIPVVQNHGHATRAPKLRREDGRIDWGLKLEDIDRKVRAFQPWPEAFTTFAGKKGEPVRLQVLAVEEEPDRMEDTRNACPGTVIESNPKLGLIVAAGEGRALRLVSVKPEGKRVMTGAELLRGTNIPVGTVLGTLLQA